MTTEAFLESLGHPPQLRTEIMKRKSGIMDRDPNFCGLIGMAIIWGIGIVLILGFLGWKAANAAPSSNQRTTIHQQAISVQRQISPPDTRYREPITVRAKPTEDQR